ncbi:rhamnulokinase [Bacteroidia bacterium]|nr:rhamnulokinase [Bacteroidia bacterium]
MASLHFLAFDLGATSGRCSVGSLDDSKLEISELTRFTNPITDLHGRLYWDILALYGHLCDALAEAGRLGLDIVSAGIDTWGVDIALLGADGSLMGAPRAYRDPYTDRAPEEFFAGVMPREELYSLTGIQIMNFNTLFQLFALKRDRSPQFEAASRILFMPDALSYMLTGNMVTEYTIASTSQLLDPRTGQLSSKLLAGLDIAPSMFAPMVMPGHTVGLLSEETARRCGVPRIPVVAVAGHDTASAVAAVPALDERFAYLSSGTWSLMGIELPGPVISSETARLNITNEGGVDGTTRLLKNITGMWLLERCLAEWKAAGRDYSYPEVVEMASAATPFVATVDPDHPSLANPASMTRAIAELCGGSGQPAPQNDAAFVRLIFESLALKYRYVLDLLRELAPFPIERLHIIGGGSQNEILNQLTANATGLPVIAGPKEATTIGNIMIQARAAGMAGSLAEMRCTIARTIDTRRYLPQDPTIWEENYKKFRTCLFPARQ